MPSGRAEWAMPAYSLIFLSLNIETVNCCLLFNYCKLENTFLWLSMGRIRSLLFSPVLWFPKKCMESLKIFFIGKTFDFLLMFFFTEKTLLTERKMLRISWIWCARIKSKPNLRLRCTWLRQGPWWMCLHWEESRRSAVRTSTMCWVGWSFGPAELWEWGQGCSRMGSRQYRDAPGSGRMPPPLPCTDEMLS